VTTRSVSPSYSYLLTERDTISLSGQYSERTYSTNDYGDNETYNLALNWLRRYSEKLSYGINFSSRNYKSDSASVSTDSDDYSLSLTLDYLFNEQLTVSGSVGARYVNGEQNYSDVGIRHYSDLGQFLDIKLNKSLERDRLSLGLSRTVSPSSTGQVNEIDKISVSYSHDITEKLVGNLNSSYQETRSATEEDNDKRENIDFTSSLNWHVDEKLQLKLSYKYRKQTQTNRDDADSNRIMLSLDYNWDDYSLSP
jgi:opacity protein-like surface antigen